MTPTVIKAQMALRSLTLRATARKIGCGEAQLSQTISGDRINPAIREKLAALFGMTAEEMFNAEFNAVVEYRKSA